MEDKQFTIPVLFNACDVPICFQNMVVVENIHDDIEDGKEVWKCLNIVDEDENIVEKRFLLEIFTSAVITYKNHYLAREKALHFNRKKLREKSLIACVVSDCMNNLNELHNAHINVTGEVPVDSTIWVEIFSKDLDEAELKERFSHFGIVSDFHIKFPTIPEDSSIAIISFNRMSEALSAKYAFDQKYFDIDDEEMRVKVEDYVGEMCEYFLLGALDIDKNSIPEDVVSITYREKGLEIAEGYDDLSKCNIFECPICGNIPENVNVEG